MRRGEIALEFFYGTGNENMFSFELYARVGLPFSERKVDLLDSEALKTEIGTFSLPKLKTYRRNQCIKKANDLCISIASSRHRGRLICPKCHNSEIK